MPDVDFSKYLHGASEKYRDCMAACAECLVACEMCSDACLGEEEVRSLAHCIRLDRSCAEACDAALRAMARGSWQAPQFCRLCAELCELCAAECEKHTHHDHCRVCAEACRRCAEECRKMAA